MSWWNPLDWAADAVMDRMEDSFESIKNRVYDDPKIILLPVGVIILTPALVAGTASFLHAAGSILGAEVATNYIEQVSE